MISDVMDDGYPFIYKLKDKFILSPVTKLIHSVYMYIPIPSPIRCRCLQYLFFIFFPNIRVVVYIEYRHRMPDIFDTSFIFNIKRKFYLTLKLNIFVWFFSFALYFSSRNQCTYMKKVQFSKKNILRRMYQ